MTSATAHRHDGDTWRKALPALELAHPIELNDEFFRASLALFPEHGEPTQCAGSLCCVEALPVVVIDAEVGFQFVPGVVGDGAVQGSHVQDGQPQMSGLTWSPACLAAWLWR